MNVPEHVMVCELRSKVIGATTSVYDPYYFCTDKRKVKKVLRELVAAGLVEAVGDKYRLLPAASATIKADQFPASVPTKGGWNVFYAPLADVAYIVAHPDEFTFEVRGIKATVPFTFGDNASYRAACDATGQCDPYAVSAAALAKEKEQEREALMTRAYADNLRWGLVTLGVCTEPEATLATPQNIGKPAHPDSYFNTLDMLVEQLEQRLAATRKVRDNIAAYGRDKFLADYRVALAKELEPA